MKTPRASLIPCLSALGVCAFIGTSAHAALLLQYDYNGTGSAPDPTIDGATSGGVGDIDNGALASGITYAAGDSRGGAGSHINFTGVGAGAIDFTGGGQNMLNSTSNATLFTDFRLNAVNTATPRLIYLSAGTGAARAEIRLNAQNSGQYTFRVGGRASDSDSFGNITSSAVTIDLNTWYSVAAVFNYSAETISIFFNGESIGSGSVASNWSGGITSNTDSASALIGNNAGVDSGFSGDLDNTRIYNDNQSANIAALSIPEPTSSAILIGTIGVLGLIRRRTA